MKTYNYKCKSCGSKKYEKIDDNTYRCAYCGCEESILPDAEDRNKSGETAKMQDANDLNGHGEEEIKFFNKLNDKVVYKIIMLLMVIFLGYLGIHKFLEKKIFLGILYIFTGGLFGIGWFIDIVVYASDLIKELGEVSK